MNVKKLFERRTSAPFPQRSKGEKSRQEMKSVRFDLSFSGTEIPLFFLSRFDAAQQPRHIMRKIPHCLESLEVPSHVIRSASVHHVPIRGRNDGHFGYREILVENIDGCGRSRAARRGYRRTGLVRKNLPR